MAVAERMSSTDHFPLCRAGVGGWELPLLGGFTENKTSSVFLPRRPQAVARSGEERDWNWRDGS